MSEIQMAQYLRSQRTLTQADVDQREASRPSTPASVRWSGKQAHRTAAPAAH
jgi:hypothetical protein